MATTTAALTLGSADLLTDALSLSATKTLHKAGSTVGLDATTGITTAFLTATTNIDIFTTLLDNSGDGPAFAGKTSWVYICNNSEDETEYGVVTISGNIIGKLYAGDFAFFPWEANADTNDIKIQPSTSASHTLEYMLFYE